MSEAPYDVVVGRQQLAATIYQFSSGFRESGASAFMALKEFLSAQGLEALHLQRYG
ncbi:hypothetical protein WDZ92_29295 [Nostoc sp. NIES-2111]